MSASFLAKFSLIGGIWHVLFRTFPLGLILIPFIESVNKFQNPFRRPVATAVFLFGTLVTLWLGAGATFPIDESLTLGLF